MVGPFAVDTPTCWFAGIAASPAPRRCMQQRCRGYLFRLRDHEPVPGALADGIVAGDRSCSVALFTHRLTAGCALARQHRRARVLARRAVSMAAGIVVSRAVIRDMFKPADRRRRVMSQVTITSASRADDRADGRRLCTLHRRLALDLLVPHRIGASSAGQLPLPLPRPCTAPQRQAFRPLLNLDARLRPAGARTRASLTLVALGERHPVQRHVPLTSLGGRPSPASTSRDTRAGAVLPGSARASAASRPALAVGGARRAHLSPSDEIQRLAVIMVM